MLDSIYKKQSWEYMKGERLELVKRIKEECAKKGLTVLEFEQAAGLPKNSIYKWDKNSPAYTKVVAVADVLRVSLDTLCRD